MSLKMQSGERARQPSWPDLIRPSTSCRLRKCWKLPERYLTSVTLSRNIFN
jgi:hypothetical protein